jgi:hypothetical protein
MQFRRAPLQWPISTDSKIAIVARYRAPGTEWRPRHLSAALRMVSLIQSTFSDTVERNFHLRSGHFESGSVHRSRRIFVVTLPKKRQRQEKKPFAAPKSKQRAGVVSVWRNSAAA